MTACSCDSVISHHGFPYINYPFRCWDRNMSGELGQYHGWWCPGSLRRQVINSHGINYAGQMDHCVTRISVSTPCAISEWRDQRTWWRHQMETFSALLAFCAGNSPVTGKFPAQRPVTRSFDVFFDLGLYQQWSKQWRCRWFETPCRSLWRHCNVCKCFLHVSSK